MHLSIGVIGGSTSPQAHDAIVLMRADRGDEGWINCSGTLVSPSIVVTAKHCVAEIPDKSFVCKSDGDLVPDGSGAGVFGATFQAESISVHLGASPSDEPAAKGTHVLVSDAYSACRDDLAILILDRPVTVPRYTPIRWNATTRVGEKVTLVGYGMGDLHHTVVRREVEEVSILEVGTTLPDERPTTPPRSFTIGGDTVCSGDSGGPALSSSGALVGTYSRITGDCFAPESRNTYMMAAGFTNMLATAFAETGESPILESASDWPGTPRPWKEGDPAEQDGIAADAAGAIPNIDSNADAGPVAVSGEQGTLGRAGAASQAGCSAAARHEGPLGSYTGLLLAAGALVARRLGRRRTAA